MNTRAAVLELFRCLLAEHAGGLTVSVTDENGKVVASARVPVGTLDREEAEGSSELRDLIIRALRGVDDPIKTATIARKAGCGYNGNFRRTIKQMREEGLIKKADDGFCYSLPAE